MTSGYSTNRIFILAGGYLIMQRDHIFNSSAQSAYGGVGESGINVFLNYNPFQTNHWAKPDVSALIK